jgi:hypothetical protein
LREALQPVYDRLERDPLTRELIAEIRTMRKGLAAANTALRCPRARHQPLPPGLKGLWRVDATRSELLAAGAHREDATRFQGSVTLELRDGGWIGRVLETGRVYRGTYTVEGDTLRLAVSDCSPSDCTPGEIHQYTWSTYREKLTLRRIPGRSAWAAFVAKPWARDH